MNLSIKELNELIYSLGITASKGLMCDKELNVSLLNKMYDELNSKIDEENEDENDWLENRLSEDSFPHYVTIEEADEDAFKTWNEAPYGNDDEDEEVKETKGITQSILDMVERQGDATYTEMNEFYKKLFGSNSFSHILKALRIPYKNRPTKRYLIKVGKNYEVRMANPSNWVVKQY